MNEHTTYYIVAVLCCLLVGGAFFVEMGQLTDWGTVKICVGCNRPVPWSCQKGCPRCYYDYTNDHYIIPLE